MIKPATAFICHPMSGNLRVNTRKVLEICKRVHSEGIIPVFPSFTWRRYLGNNAKDRALAEAVNRLYFSRRFVDEVWLFGDRLSDGMKKEIRLALEYNILIVAKTPETKKALRKFLKLIPQMC